MIICICNGISEKDMEEAVTEGYGDFDELLTARNVCFQCRMCEDVAREKFKQLVTKEKNESR
jgi:bacterioferritin-associated ferredoxin|tara:strand:+ start:144 stop:329 length:186 start_codon:yes stop_codon:yes gene_type:complete